MSQLYVEGLFWYLFLVDALIYNVMSWSRKYPSHWLSSYFPLNRFFGIFYLGIVLWLGFALSRMDLLGFSFS